MSDVTSQLFDGQASLLNGQHVSEDGATRAFSDFTIAGSIAARLRLVALEGNLAVSAGLEHSDDGDSWSRLLAFSAAVADGEEIVQVTGPKKYVRAAWTVTGSGVCKITIDVNPGIPGAPTTIVVAEPPTADEIPVGQARIYATNDQFNGIEVRVRARGARAGFSDDVVAYVDRTGFSSDGDGTTIEHAKSELEHQPLTVDVDGRAITVNFATGGDAVAAAGSLGDDNAYLGFTAKETGPAGDAISIGLVRPDGETADTTASADDTEITVELAQTAGPDPVQATLTTDLGSNADLKWTIGPVDTGAAGDGIHVQYEADGGLAAHEVHAGGDSETCLFTYGSGTTAQDVLDYLANTVTNPPLSDFFAAELAPGSDGTGAIADGTWDFADGVDAGDITATAADVKAAIEADTDSAALVAVDFGTGDGSGTVDAGDVELSGGLDEAYETSNAVDVVDAIGATPAAGALVAVKAVSEDPPNVTEGPQALSGGDPDALIDATLWSD